jgi:2-C-methyl-D-erythritol 2,4-cyclodiphosphate synthase
MVRTGIGYDSHCLVTERRLVLGGVEIPHSHGLLGHSDADVLIHAICDALLGAIAEGDIGQHFPDRDPQWKDADSTQLLRAVVELVHKKCWEIAHVDASVIAEAPKLQPYIPAMRARLCQILDVSIDRISVKAKSNEGMDAVGRREGISCMAVATVARHSQQNEF